MLPIDYVVHNQKAGALSSKVFKWIKVNLKAPSYKSYRAVIR